MLVFRFANSMAYFGISFNSSGLPGGNMYLNLALLGIVGMVASIVCYAIVDKISRRLFLFIAAFSSGVAILVATFLPKGKTQ